MEKLQNRWGISAEIETTRKNQIEISENKNMVTEMK